MLSGGDIHGADEIVLQSKISKSDHTDWSTSETEDGSLIDTGELMDKLVGC